MQLARTTYGVALALMLSTSVHAQENSSSIPALTDEAEEEPIRIVPKQSNPKEAGMLSTHENYQEPVKPLPWVKQPSVNPAPAANPAPGGSMPLPANLPFARTPAAPVVPSGPHSTVAVPVGNVDAVEVQEAAPATPIAPAADPAKEDPAQPTELTSPIFDPGEDDHIPRKIIFRVLNKVTAQSAVFEEKPGAVVKFGKIDITAIMCRASSPTSQTDYAGLFEVREHIPAKEETKNLFRGWMYASSPSITGLEHPIYDVTMVECKITMPAAKVEEKPEKNKKK